MCPIFRGSTVHKEEDNLSIVDETASPNVSYIQRFHNLSIVAEMAGSNVSFMHCIFMIVLLEKIHSKINS